MRWSTWVLIGIGVWFVVLFLFWALLRVARPQTPEEQAAEDEAQGRYLSERAKRHAR